MYIHYFVNENIYNITNIRHTFIKKKIFFMINNNIIETIKFILH
jgi:hypothetical protein